MKQVYLVFKLYTCLCHSILQVLQSDWSSLFEKKLGHNPDQRQQGNNIHDSTEYIHSGCESSHVHTHKCYVQSVAYKHSSWLYYSVVI